MKVPFFSGRWICRGLLLGGLLWAAGADAQLYPAVEAPNPADLGGSFCYGWGTVSISNRVTGALSGPSDYAQVAASNSQNVAVRAYPNAGCFFLKWDNPPENVNPNALSWNKVADAFGEDTPQALFSTNTSGAYDPVSYPNGYGDFDCDWLGDTWENQYSGCLNPTNATGDYGRYGNPDEDYLPGLVYPLNGSNTVTFSTEGYKPKSTIKFHNYHEFAGFDGIRGTLDDPGTDPCTDDTDEDGLPDGWEYYFWVLAQTNGLFEGHALDWTTFTSSTVIAAADIVTWFDPLTDNGSGDQDLDLDGLNNAEEYANGTNPIEWDTDGDGIPDGWEQYYLDQTGDRSNFNPLDPTDADKNPDGDFMAFVDKGDTIMAFDSDSVWRRISMSDGTNAFRHHEVYVNNLPGTMKDAYFAYGGYGFDPRVGWGEEYTDAGEDPLSDGLSVSPTPFTIPYTTLQEYLLAAYRRLNIATTNGVNEDTSSIASFDDVIASWTTNPNAQDTDNDGIYDGWELYVGLDPRNGDDADEGTTSPLVEFQCTDVVLGPGGALAPKGSTYPVDAHPWVFPYWLNKFWPTDPNVADTDGDLVDDYGLIGVGEGNGESDNRFMYMQGVPVWDSMADCFLGGGMNPCGVDSDNDALPDKWEYWYKFAEGGPFESGVSGAGMDPTARDAIGFDYDYDGDGLQNWEEYMVGAMRQWQWADLYAPPVTTNIEDEGSVWVFYAVDDGFTFRDASGIQRTFSEANWDWFYERYEIVDDNTITYRGIKPSTYNWFQFNLEWPAKNAYDVQLPEFVLPSGEYPGCRGGTHWDWHRFWKYDPLSPVRYAWMPPLPNHQFSNPSFRYATCNPTQADSDNDGMNDYYEVYHMMSPIFGDADLVDWQPGPENVGVTPFAVRGNAFDYALNPWNAGSHKADFDNDGLLNADENIRPQAIIPPPFYHTDPSPAWIADVSYDKSWAHMYYRIGKCPFWFNRSCWGSEADPPPSFWFDFECNEGYDTDNDNIPDRYELVSNSEAPGYTDPLDPQNPVRRRALWVDGQSAARTFMGTMIQFEDTPRNFTIETWVRPQRVPFTNEQTIIERAASGVPAGSPIYGSGLRYNFRLALAANGAPFVMYNGNGGTITSVFARASAAHALDTNRWTHLAATYDGVAMKLKLYMDGELVASTPSAENPFYGWIVAGTDPTPYPAAVTIGASDMNPTDGSLWRKQYLGWGGVQTEPPSLRNGFKGWIDEVRVWNGARAQADIQADQFTTYRWPEVAAAATNPVPGALIYCYNFDSLPDPDYTTAGQADFGRPSDNVSPQNFDTVVAQTWPSGQQRIFWWEQTPVRSTVYTNYAYLPWIENLVPHLALDPPLDSPMHIADFSSSSALVTTQIVSQVVTNGGAIGTNTVIQISTNTVITTATNDFPNTSNPYGLTYKLPYPVEQIDDLKDLMGFDSPLYVLAGAFGSPMRDFTGAWESYPGQWTERTLSFGSTPREVGLYSDLLPLFNAQADEDVVMWDGLGSGRYGPSADDPADSDGDGMADWYEIAHGLDPLSAEGENGGAADNDGDGLSNYNEYLAGTDPENIYSAAGLVTDFDLDSDGDGLANGVEAVTYMTNPGDPDTDDDNIADGDELDTLILKNGLALTSPTDSRSPLIERSAYLSPADTLVAGAPSVGVCTTNALTGLTHYAGAEGSGLNFGAWVDLNPNGLFDGDRILAGAPVVGTTAAAQVTNIAQSAEGAVWVDAYANGIYDKDLSFVYGATPTNGTPISGAFAPQISGESVASLPASGPQFMIPSNGYLAVADGATMDFFASDPGNNYLIYTPIQPGSVTINFYDPNGVPVRSSVRDDGSGSLFDFPPVYVGDVDYLTGYWELHLTNALPADTRLEVSYYFYSNAVHGAGFPYKALTNLSVVPNTVTVRVSNVSNFRDDGAGGLMPAYPGVGTGTLNYTTGAWELTDDVRIMSSSAQDAHVAFSYAVLTNFSSAFDNGAPLAVTPVVPGAVLFLVNGRPAFIDDGAGLLQPLAGGSGAGSIDYLTGAWTISNAVVQLDAEQDTHVTANYKYGVGSSGRLRDLVTNFTLRIENYDAVSVSPGELFFTGTIGGKRTGIPFTNVTIQVDGWSFRDSVGSGYLTARKTGYGIGNGYFNYTNGEWWVLLGDPATTDGYVNVWADQQRHEPLYRQVTVYTNVLTADGSPYIWIDVFGRVDSDYRVDGNMGEESGYLQSDGYGNPSVGIWPPLSEDRYRLYVKQNGAFLPLNDISIGFGAPAVRYGLGTGGNGDLGFLYLDAQFAKNPENTRLTMNETLYAETESGASFFYGTLSQTPVVADTVEIIFGPYTFADNGSGALVTQTPGATGEVLYASGAWAIDTGTNNTFGWPITGTYDYTAQDRGFYEGNDYIWYDEANGRMSIYDDETGLLKTDLLTNGLVGGWLTNVYSAQSADYAPGDDLWQDLLGTTDFDEEPIVIPSIYVTNGATGVGLPDAFLVQNGTPHASYQAGDYVWVENSIYTPGDEVCFSVAVDVPELGETRDDRFALDAWTIECWFRPDTTNETGSILRRDTITGQVNYELGLTNNRPYVRYTSETGNEIKAGLNAAIPAGQWSHLTGVFDPAGGSLSLYVNGISFQSQWTATPCATGTNGMTRVLQAAGTVVLGEGLNGHVDDLRVWGLARTADEIATWFDKTLRDTDPVEVDTNAPVANPGSITVTSGGEPLTLWNALLDGTLPAGVTDLTVSFTGATEAAGTFFGFPTLPNEMPVPVSGIVLASGLSESAGNNTNSSPSVSYNFNLPGDDALTALVGNAPTYDAVALVIDFTTDASVDGLSFKVLFASEEFPEFVGTSFNDAFAAFLDGQNITFDANNQPLTVNNNFFEIDNDPWDPDNPASEGKLQVDLPFEYDGLTPLLITSKALTPGQHQLRLVVGDAGDHVLDSIAFLSDLKFELIGAEGTAAAQTVDTVGGGTSGLVAYYTFDDSQNTTATNALTGRALAHGAEDAAHALNWRYAISNVVFSSENADLRELRNDSDADGMDDWWETFFFGGDADPAADPDNDGLVNLYEFLSGTNPESPDTDNNGVLDGQEDADADGLNNLAEQDAASHPLYTDTDDDGLSDHAEQLAFSSPVNALSPVADRALRLDGSTNSFAYWPYAGRFGLTDWTIEAWVKPMAMTSTAVIIEREVQEGAWNFKLEINAQGQPVASFTSVEGALTNAVSVTATVGSGLPLNTWSHVGAVYSEGDRMLATLVNGEVVGEVRTDLRPVVNGVYGGRVRLGSGFDGMIDDVRVWDTVPEIAMSQTSGTGALTASDELGGAAAGMNLSAGRYVLRYASGSWTDAQGLHGSVALLAGSPLAPVGTADGRQSHVFDWAGGMAYFALPSSNVLSVSEGGVSYSVQQVVKRARTLDDLSEPLTGFEQGLVGYLRFDDSTSATNDAGRWIGTSGQPWSRGQVQDFKTGYADDWMTQWRNAATLNGGAWMTNAGANAPLATARTDSDGDGIPDAWEMEHFGNLWTAGVGAVDGYTDYDGDGLNDLYEYKAQTDPKDIDTDNNGVGDAAEDPDGDALSNGEEQQYGTDPLATDTDDDSVNDYAEVHWLPAGQERSPIFSMGGYSNTAYAFVLTNAPSVGLTLPQPVTALSESMSDWTLESMFYADAPAGQTGALVLKTVGSRVAAELGVDAGVPYVLLDASVTGTSLVRRIRLDAASAVSGATWTHLAASYNSLTRTLQLAVDANLVFSKTLQADEGEPLAGSGRLAVGVGAWSGTALVDNVRLWNGSRTPRQLDEYRLKLPEAGAERSLLYELRFDDGGLSVENFAKPQNADYYLVAAEYGVGEAGGNALWLSTNAATYYVMDDANSDRMPDWWTSLHKVTEVSGDPDGDGLGNLYEYMARTDPNEADTFNDGTLDADRYAVQADGAPSELKNIEEQRFGSDPRYADTDDDGMTDAGEVKAAGWDEADWPVSDPAGALQNTNDAPQLVRRSLSFDGASRVVVPMQAKYGLDNWTVEAWVRADAPAGNDTNTVIRRMVEESGGVDVLVNYELGVEVHSGAMYPYVRYVGTNVAGAAVPVKVGGWATPAAFALQPLSTDTWTHLAATYESNTNRLTLFVNGRPAVDNSRTNITVRSPAFGASYPEVTIGGGRDSGGVQNGFDGAIDEVRVWGSAIGASGVFDVFRTADRNAVGGYDMGADAAPGSLAASVAQLPLTNALAVEHKPDELLMRFKPEVGAAQAASVLSNLGLEQVKQYSAVPILKVRIDDGQSLSNKLAALRAQTSVLYAEPIYKMELSRTPDDANFDDLWGMKNTGQFGGTIGADIDAESAWDISVGTRDVIVAVIDTGVDYNHVDLADNMWVNTGEIPDNGIDDDGNGYIDDVHGYDFAYGDGDPMDVYGHGTHCAGTIAAVGNNGVGVVGVSWNARIMAVKGFMDFGGAWTDDLISAIEYSILMGAHISNNSWGGFGFSQALYDMIDQARQVGQLFCAAAGNYGMDNDGSLPAYPASYDLPNIVAVAASDDNDELTWWSNYGETSVDLAAPGDNILSTTPGDSYAYYSGTSMATPHVAGAAALLLSVNPGMGYGTAKAALMNSVDRLETLGGKMVTGGRLNAASALSTFAGLVAYFRSDDGGQTVEDLTVVNDVLEDWRHAATFAAGAAFTTNAYAQMSGDSDGDGMPDWFETAYDVADASDDPDLDGLDNLNEYQAGLNPLHADTWNSGTSDDQLDSDADGLINLTEQQIESDPGLADTDDDGIADATEFADKTMPNLSLSPMHARAAQLTGAADPIRLPDQPRFALAEGWTVEAWIHPTNAAADAVIVQRRVGLNGINYALGLKLNGGALYPYATVADWDGNDRMTTNATPVELGRWTHLAAAYDTDAGELALFVDGERVGVIGVGFTVPTSTEAGRGDAVLGDGLAGLLDEVRIWSVARTETQIAAQMYPDLSGSESGLVAYYRFDDGTSWQAAPFVGTSRGADPARWNVGQIEEFASSTHADWRNDWFNGATIQGDVIFTNGASLPNAETDSDGDGMPDWWEYRYFGNLFTSDGTEDHDDDGLMDRTEYFAHTDPTNPYTYGGAVRDDQLDSDGDGLNNIVEQNQYESDPGNPDTDDDGVNDGLEAVHVTALTHPMSVWSTNLALYNMAQPRSLAMGDAPAGGVELPEPDRFQFLADNDWTTEYLIWDGTGFTNVWSLGLSGWSIEAWINMGSDSNGQLFAFDAIRGDSIRFGLVDGSPYGEIVKPNGEIAVRVGGVRTNAGGVASVEAGKWTHLALGWSPLDNTFRLYRDGILVIAQETLYQTQFERGRAFLARNFEDGYLDNVRMWDRIREASEIEYWHYRMYPAPGYVSRPVDGYVPPVPTARYNDITRSVYAYDHMMLPYFREGYEYGQPLVMDYRFDDGGLTIEDFAHLNEPAYALVADVTTDEAYELLGTDDADGDGLPEWWVKLHNLELYRDYNYGPFHALENKASDYPVTLPAGWDTDDGAEGQNTRIYFYSQVGVYTGDTVTTYYNVWLDIDPVPLETNAAATNATQELRENYWGKGVYDATNDVRVWADGYGFSPPDVNPPWFTPDGTYGMNNMYYEKKGADEVYELGDDIWLDIGERSKVYDLAEVIGIWYYRTFTSYGSLGDHVAWWEDEQYKTTKDSAVGEDGFYSAFTKYVYCDRKPTQADMALKLFDVDSFDLYINGTNYAYTADALGRNTLDPGYSNLVSMLRKGRNGIYLYTVNDEGGSYNEGHINYDGEYIREWTGMKFDCSLTLDGVPAIVRGDDSVADPRAVWHGAAWSKFFHQEITSVKPFPDDDNKGQRHPDYGIPLDPDGDLLDDYYEIKIVTNPRDVDTDNDGVRDGEEDYDGDELNNLTEQAHGADPRLVDTDDDLFTDGFEVAGGMSPVDALEPFAEQVLLLDGSATNYLEAPIASRFALSDWTVGAWVRTPTNDPDGEIVAREVGPGEFNYNLGWWTDGIGARHLSVRFTDGEGEAFTVWTTNTLAVDTWTHVAGRFDSSNGTLALFLDGQALESRNTAKRPLTYAGGPVATRCGRGFLGKMDNVLIYSRALADAEIVAMTNSVDFGTSETNGLVAFYRFDDRTYTNGTSGSAAWDWGQVQDFAGRAYRADWANQWRNAATLRGGARASQDRATPGAMWVTSPDPNGVYYLGQTVTVWVVFSEPISAVFGAPMVELDLNVTNRFAYYSSFADKTAVFEYTVQQDDWSWDLSYVATNALLPNGGFVMYNGLTPMDLTLPEPGAYGSLSWNKDLVVSTPNVTEVDGIPVAWLLQYFGTIVVDPYGDADGDGSFNIEEYIAGTIPTDANSFFEVEQVDLGSVEVRWSALSGRKYTVEYNDSLDMPVWTAPAAWTEIPYYAPTMSIMDDGAWTGGLNTNRFYRIYVEMQ